MEMQAEYYLHENGSLICKPNGGVQADSSFVKGVWLAREIGATPQRLVEWFKEVLTMGAKPSEIVRIAEYNKLENHIKDWSYEVFGRYDVKNGKCIHGVKIESICNYCDEGLPF